MPRRYKFVSEEEFNTFIEHYPNRLVEDKDSETVISYADLALGLWPDSIVARFYNNFVPEACKFEVLENFKEIREERSHSGKRQKAIR